MMRHLGVLALVASAMVITMAAHGQELTDNLFADSSFEEGMTEREPFGVPTGWTLYDGSSEESRLELVEPGHESDHALLIRDGDAMTEIGIYQDVEAEGGIGYEASAMVKALEPASGGGAYIQLRFSPSGEFVQVSLARARSDEFTRIAAIGMAPEATTEIRVYFYTPKGPTPHFLIDDVRLIGGVVPPPPPPEPVPPV